MSLRLNGYPLLYFVALTDSFPQWANVLSQCSMDSDSIDHFLGRNRTKSVIRTRIDHSSVSIIRFVQSTLQGKYSGAKTSLDSHASG
jgi:hypothetical protein